MKKIVLVTGGFDPLHSGHIEYFKEARKLGDELHVGLNSDEWLTRKKGRPFMSFQERATIIENLNMVDCVISFDDVDDTACGAIYKTLATHGPIKILFANGGDRQQDNTPEYKTYHDIVEFAYDVGGNKKNSSSWILEEWKSPKTKRSWGLYRVLDDKPGYKVKELVIEPGKSLSMQRHFKRSEHWYMLKGSCNIATEYNNITDSIVLQQNKAYDISKNVWHQASNPSKEHCHILEVQYGTKCVEEDIERKE